MKILHTCHKFSLHSGGSSVFWYEVSKRLVGLGHDVTVLCQDDSPEHGTTLDPVSIIDGIKVHALKIPRDYHTYMDIFLKGDYDVRVGYDTRTWCCLWLAENNFRQVKQPFIFWPCQPEYDTYKFRELEKQAAYIVSWHNKAVYGDIPIHPGYSPEEVKSADFERTFAYKYNIEDDFIFSPTSYWPHKNPMLLNEIATPDRKVVMCGYGQEDKEKWQFNENIIALDVLPRQEVLQAYSECKLVVSPSKWEGYGIVPLEAYGFGKPWVAFDTGGAWEVPQGIVVNNNDEFINAVNFLWDNPGAVKVEPVDYSKWTWEYTTDLVENLYLRATGL